MRQPGTPHPKNEVLSERQKAASNGAQRKEGPGGEQQAEEALRESQARMARIVDTIITVDKEQSVLAFNRAAERMFLCPAEESHQVGLTASVLKALALSQ